MKWGMLAILIGWCGFGLLVPLGGALADRGFGIARPLAILLVAYLAWVTASLTPLPFSDGLISASLAVVAVLGAVTAWRHRGQVGAFLVANGRLVLGSEIVFLVAYGFALAIRAWQPELWHPWFGGEKPMDLAYLTAVLRSESFPPHDPWFAGGYMNYYYFGFVLVAVISLVLQTPPAVAYNLAMALWFALACQAVYCLSLNIYAGIASNRNAISGRGITPREDAPAPPILVGVLGVVLVMLCGTLWTAHSLLADAPTDAGRWQWFWNATRIIPHLEAEAPPITEFPFFSFLYGDLHAHFLALPLFISLLVWLIVVSHGVSRFDGLFRQFSALALLALLLGSMYAINGWNLPAALLLVIGSLLISARSHRAPPRFTMLSFALILALAWLMWLPYIGSFRSAYGEVLPWRGSRTPLGSMLLLYGPFLAPVTLCLLVDIRALLGRMRRAVSLPVFTGLAILLSIAWVALSLRIPAFWIALPMVLVSATLLVAADTRSEMRYWNLLVCLAAGIIAGVEVLVITGDLGRMNTVFKFSYLAWVLLAVAAAVAIGVLWCRLACAPRLRVASMVASVLPVIAALFYAPVATVSKMNYTFDPDHYRGLDGMRFMERATHEEGGVTMNLNHDYQALRWLQENVDGTPVIASGRSPQEYRWGSRVSVFTGLPEILGWRWHQVQQKSLLPDSVFQQRIRDSELIFAGHADEVILVIRRYDVRYIYYGDIERVYYGERGEVTFEELAGKGVLSEVYRNATVTIYAVNSI